MKKCLICIALAVMALVLVFAACGKSREVEEREAKLLERIAQLEKEAEARKKEAEARKKEDEAKKQAELRAVNERQSQIEGRRRFARNLEKSFLDKGHYFYVSTQGANADTIVIENNFASMKTAEDLVYVGTIQSVKKAGFREAILKNRRTAGEVYRWIF